MSADAFLDRVFANLPTAARRFEFKAWKQAGRSTAEGVGVLPASAVDIDAVAQRVMDVDHYVGNVDHVVECRAVSDVRFTPPQRVRFYQRIKVPVLAEVQHELVLEDRGDRDGWRVLAWYQLDPETAALGKKQGARSEYNVGAWLVRSDRLAYALCSAPRKQDVGRLKYAALTKGADAGAARIVQGNIEGMLRWSKRG